MWQGRSSSGTCVARCLSGVDAVLHAATLHKPHVGTHAREAFLQTNVLGTLILLEEAARARVRSFVMTSTTSAFGDALKRPAGRPGGVDRRDASFRFPKNIYGVTKAAAEDLCRLFWRNERLPCIVLRTSRFFPEADDDPERRAAFADDNPKTNEFLFRRVAIEDVVDAHLAAIERAPAIGFGKYIISATTPFRHEDASAPARRRAGGRPRAGAGMGGRISRGAAGAWPPGIDRVYDNALARRELGWRPRWDFQAVIARLSETGDIRGPLARAIGEKGYHAERLEGQPYPVDGGSR